MKPKTSNRRLALSAAALAVASTALLGATQASATESTVNSWSTWDSPVRCVDSSGASITLCLYYSSGANGAFDPTYQYQDGEIKDTFWKTDQYGSAGYGQAVRNNAASVENASGCTIGVWVSPWFYGDVDYVPAFRGGTLTWNLRNNEASWACLPYDRGGQTVLT